jgi:hypothetical protein
MTGAKGKNTNKGTPAIKCTFIDTPKVKEND